MKTNRILHIIALGGVLLWGCSRDDGFRDTPNGDAVNFTAGIAAATRTTGGGDEWVAGDKVGIYMLASNGKLTAPADVLADNMPYLAVPGSPASAAAFVPEYTSQTIYYPLSGTVDFIAYYPHGTVTGGIYNINVTDQTDPAAIDALYAKTTGMSKSDPEVRLTFAHALSKVTLDVKAGTGFTAADISALEASAVAFGGMPATASLALQNGALTAGTDLAQTFNPLKNATPPDDFDASFTALLVPQAANAYQGRTVTFTAAGQPYTWTIPDTETFAAGYHYVYPVTVNKTEITVGDPEIIDWTTHDNGTGTAFKIVPEANSYMVVPNSAAIYIPVSQANRVMTVDGLGAAITELGGVTANSFTVELVWGDTPVADGGVIEEIRAHGEYVYMKPGVAGNAVIAIRDKTSNKIKWSWHIWVTEPVASATDTETGLTWMDRNLGAAANTPLVNGVFDKDQWKQTLGLYYQWGRKDAFPPSDGTKSNRTYYIGDATTGTNAALPTGTYTELPDMVQNPLTFATNHTAYYGSLNVEGTDNKSWSDDGAKTIYDPCPPGWKVPPLQISGMNSWGNKNSTDWPSGSPKQGRIFNGVNGTASLGHFYPASGLRSTASGSLDLVATYGYYWSDTPNDKTQSRSLAFFSNTIATQNTGTRASGLAVRCVAE